jgi:hypothetical protein
MAETGIEQPTGAQGEETPPRCYVGSKSSNPCWRTATERLAPQEETPTLCPEHARLACLSGEVDDWSIALATIEEWIRGPVAEDSSGHLERLAINLRDEVRTEYAAASAAAYAAKLVAQQGPPGEGEPSLTLEQAEELARLIVRADSFANARTLAEDVPEEALEMRDRWGMVDALAAAAREASKEASRYKEALGFPRLEERGRGCGTGA